MSAAGGIGVEATPLEVAVIHFGLARNLRATLPSIRDALPAAGPGSGLRLTQFAALNLVGSVESPRSRENGVKLDPAEVFLLEADAYDLVRQDDGAIAGLLAAAQRRADAFRNGWSSVRNLLHQLTSLRRGWQLAGAQGRRFDRYLFLRPDLHYLDPIDVAGVAGRFPGRGCVALPDWHSWNGLNDRFALADPVGAEAYANRIALVPDFLAREALHGERLLEFALRRAGVRVGALPVRARRVRATGRVEQEGFTRHRRGLPEIPAPLGRRAPDAAGADPTRGAGPAAWPAGAARRREVDGFPRVAPLSGPHYLGFLRAFHERAGVARYLEIGTQRGASLGLARGQAISVDPAYRLDRAAWSARPGMHLFETGSDEFFAAEDPVAILGGPLDLGFIDGMHLSDFVLRDFVNTERSCARDGAIAIHDVLPGNFEMAERIRRPEARRDRALHRHWTGDVWRIVPLLRRERPDLRLELLDCAPTGLLLVTGLDPGSTLLADRLDVLAAELAGTDPTEEEFWRFVETVEVADAAGAIARLPARAA